MDERGVSRGLAISVGWFALLVGLLLVASAIQRFGLVGWDGKLYLLLVAGVVLAGYLVVETGRYVRARLGHDPGEPEG